MSPTTTTAPTATENKNTTLEVTRNVFDLDSKGEVTVRKVGTFEPVTTMEEFVSRLGNDAGKILAIVNDGLKEYTQAALLSDANVPWQLVDEDEEGKETLAPFTGTLLTPEKSKGLQATVINFAKLLFGYSKNMVPGDAEKNRAAKKAAKDAALNAILSNPAAIEGLKAK